jgi:hypothetical protein
MPTIVRQRMLSFESAALSEGNSAERIHALNRSERSLLILVLPIIGSLKVPWLYLAAASWRGFE